MRHILHKCSVPGWSKEFASQEAARAELLAHICEGCLLGNDEIEMPAPDVNDIDSLLGTPCGCEYEYEEVA